MTRLRKYLRNLVKLGLLLSLPFICINCTLKEPTYNKSEVEQKIVASFKRELDLDVTTRIAENTLYVYIPTPEQIIEIARVQAPEEKKHAVWFINIKHEADRFLIEYAAKDLPASKVFFKNISFNYTPYAQKAMNKAYSSLFEALTDSEDGFDFFVVYIADISRGIEMKLTINERDLKKYYTGALPFMQFGTRVIVETTGNKQIIGDTEGDHIKHTSLNTVDFINDLFVYQLSYGIPRKDNSSITKEILKIFYEITTSYDFIDYLYVNLRDVLSEKETTYTYTEIENMFSSHAQPTQAAEPSF